MSSFFDVHASPLPILYDVPDTMVTAVAESKSEDRPSDRSPCDRPQNMHGEPLEVAESPAFDAGKVYSK